MPSRFDRNRRVVGTTSGKGKRKLSVPSVKISSVGLNKTNDEYVMRNAAAISSIGLLAGKIAEIAKESSVKTSELIANISQNLDSSFDSRELGNIITEKDFSSLESIKTADIINSLTDSQKSKLSVAAHKIIGNSLISKNDTLKGKSHVAPLEAPEINHITSEINRNKGVIDAFYNRISYTLPLDKVVVSENSRGFIHAVRIFRSEVPASFSREIPTLSINAISKIKSDKIGGSKNYDPFSKIASRLSENLVKNAISSLTPIDSTFNARVASQDSQNAFSSQVSSLQSGIQGDPRNISSDLAGLNLGLDKSVLENPKVIRNIQLYGKISPIVLNNSVLVGKNAALASDGLSPIQARQSQDGFNSPSNFVVTQNNLDNFKQIAFLSLPVPGKFDSNTRIVGDGVEYIFEDETVDFGVSYKYYIVAIDSSMRESQRSNISEITLNGMRVPECPKNVIAFTDGNSVSLSIAVDDQLVEKFEIYRAEVGGFQGKASLLTNSISAVSNFEGFPASKKTVTKQLNGFIQVGEALNISGPGGAIFQDKKIQRGKKYSYRVYSVDIFGNKSERPNNVSIFIVDNDKKNELDRLNLLAEVDAATNKIKCSFFSTDSRVVGFFLTRRDLTNGQQFFSPPGDVARNKISSFIKPYQTKNAEGNLVRGDNIWNGFFKNENIYKTFVDETVQNDHIYQYQLIGIDRFGNKTNPEFSSKIFVSSRPLINPPENFSGIVEFYNNNTISGVNLTWKDGNLEFSAEDLIGNQTVLDDNSKRTLYQLERQKAGDGNWYEFPLILGTTFSDRIKDGTGLDVGSTYFYRIQNYQTGSFISNFSAPIQINVDFPLRQPMNLKLTTPNTKVKPFFVMINWDTEFGSGVVDKWMIERAEINNLAAASLNFKNLNNASSLNFKKFRTVFKESSRFKSQTVDDKFQKQDLSGLIVGKHHFMDSEVKFGQSYFYRIKAFSTSGLSSQWSIKGIKLSDPNFDKKQNSVLSLDEKNQLSFSDLPSTFKSDLLSSKIETINTSFSMLPTFSRPDVTLDAVTTINLDNLSGLDSLSNVKNLEDLNTSINFTPINLEPLPILSPTIIESSQLPTAPITTISPILNTFQTTLSPTITNVAPTTLTTVAPITTTSPTLSTFSTTLSTTTTPIITSTPLTLSAPKTTLSYSTIQSTNFTLSKL